MTPWSADLVVDAREHRCPMPLLMAKRGLNTLEPGQRLVLLATDPGSERDFQTFSRQSGHALIEQARVDDEFHFMLKKC